MQSKPKSNVIVCEAMLHYNNCLYILSRGIEIKHWCKVVTKYQKITTKIIIVDT